MFKAMHSLLAKQIASFLFAGVLLTVGFVYIESRMFVDVLFQQQGNAYEVTGRHAMENIDLLLQEARNGLIQLSNMSGMIDGDKAQIVDDLKKNLENYIQLFRRTYYVDADGTMYSSSQVVLEVLQRTMDYDQPRTIIAQPSDGGSFRMSDIYRSNMLTDNTIAIYRKTSGGGAVMAELELEIIAEYIAQAFGAEEIPYVLFTRTGSKICGRLPQNLSEEQIWTVTEGGSRQWTQYTDENKRYLRFYNQSEFAQCDWILTIILDETEVYASLWRLIRMTIVISGLLMLGVIGFLSIIAGHFVKPIRKLTKQMDQIQMEGSQLNGFEPIRRNDEIGALSDNIERMLKRINSMVVQKDEAQRQQYNAELRALQYQMRPHFLYNTLNMLSALAISHQQEKIPHAVSALVHILLVSTDKVGPAIRLEEELQCTREFMHIITLRYGNHIDLSVSIPEDMRDCVVPKLILQPIVENSVFHGCVPSNRQGLIVIQGETESDMLAITIMDNGVGMTQKRIDEVLSDGNAEEIKPTGLNSVDSRIRLYFGEAYGLEVESTPDVGTKVKVRLPRMKNVDEWEEWTR